jgi:putative nucleotidyltransferase with HDIG domain
VPSSRMTPRRTHRDFFLIASIMVLAALAARLDEIVDAEVPGWATLGDLAAAALVVLVMLILLERSDGERTKSDLVLEHERRAKAIDDVLLTMSRGGHAEGVLETLAREACEILDVEKSAVVMRDRSDPRSSVVVAGNGLPDDLIGHRFGIDEGMFGEVILTGEPALVDDYRRFPRAVAHSVAKGLCGGGAVPIHVAGAVEGALTAATTDPQRKFGRDELEKLARLAELGSIALEQAAMREQLERAVDSGVEAMAAAVDIRDNYTAEHSVEVATLARDVGERLGLDSAGLAKLEVAARLHDVGKIGVPDSVLGKNGELDRSEWEVMRQHSVWGAEMLKRIRGLDSVAKIVRHGHERWDGDGYPDRLRRDEIPIESRIILACDAYHAMTSDRPYREALRPWLAVSELREGAGNQFDPEVVDALLKTLRETSGSRIRLFEPAGSRAG